MSKKVIAYVSDIVLGSTGEVIRRETQMEAIRRHARENGYEIIAVFEDDLYSEDIVSRPGIQKLMEFAEPYELVLVERVWALSRKWSLLSAFLEEMTRGEHRVESTVCLWDCVSQRARWYFRRLSRDVPAVCTAPQAPAVAASAPQPATGPAAAVVPETPAVTASPPPRRVRVAEPPRLNFIQLCRRLADA